MEKDKVCMPRILKNIAYVLAPIILVILLLLIICLSYPIEREAIENKLNFLNTKSFADLYSSEIYGSFSIIRNFLETGYFSSGNGFYVVTEEVQGNDEVNTIYYYYEYKESNVKWLIIDKESKEAFTNTYYAEYNYSIEEMIEQITSKEVYWNYIEGEVDSSIEKLKNVSFVESSLPNTTNNADRYEIYTSLLDTLEYPDDIYQVKLIYNILFVITPNAMYFIPVLVIMLIALVPIVIIGVGRKKGQKEISLNWFDKILIEAAGIITLVIIGIGAGFVQIIGTPSDMLSFVVYITFIGVGLLIIYLACILFFETVVKRLKTHTFVKTLFIYWLYIKSKELLQNIKLTKYFIWYFIGYLLANLISLVICTERPLIGFILLLLINIYAYKLLSERIKGYNKIKIAINDLYKGETDIKLKEDEFTKSDRTTAKEINDIAGGLSNAINEKLKSERLKTELITNVSHDIKTPLTSIINYVDLLKKENIEGEKVQEYLNIIDNKSQRLKKLTEDLIEASKASSGAIKLNMENLNVNELIKQVSGEFQDKFKLRNLQEIMNLPEKAIYIQADSRYLYRVLENMYSNIDKYAMDGTRVYIDVIEESGKIKINLKNVSKQKLNISVDELMQRFVRGDSSRNTEGSGLGLSIARSLTELQKGKFDIYLDGDLFKVTIEFDSV